MRGPKRSVDCDALLTKGKGELSHALECDGVAETGGTDMMMEYIALAGFILAIFVAGVAVGKLVEKVERFISKSEDEEHRSTHKNNRR